MDIAAQKSYRSSKIHPHIFAMWIAFGSITMMFGAFTSAYIVKKAAGNWLEFKVPDLFFISTVVIILSSITLQLSYSAFKKQKESVYKLGLIATLILGIAFVVLQYKGWYALYDIGVDLKANVSGSFFYLITGVHAAHVLGGIAGLIVAIIHAFSLVFKPTEKRRVRFTLVLQYWHFIGILWLYLFGFLLLT